MVRKTEKGLAGGALVVADWNVRLAVGVAVWGKVAEGIGPDIGVTIFHGVGVEGFVVSGIGGFVDGGGGA